MPIERRFVDNGHIWYTKVADPWTVEELLAAVSDNNIFMEPGGDQLHLIVDLSESRHYPLNTLRLRDVGAFTTPRTGQTVVVAANEVGHRIFELFEQMRHIKIVYVNTLDEALAYLHPLIAANNSQEDTPRSVA